MEDLQSDLNAIVNNFEKILTLHNPKNLQPDLISHVKVEAYDTLMILKELASIVKIDSSTLEIKPFDILLLKNIEKELWNLQKGTIIKEKDRLLFILPTLTTDTILSIVKKTKPLLEEHKIKIRNIRQKYIDNMKKDNDNNKDMVKKNTDNIQKYINEANNKLEYLFVNFEKKLL